MVDTYRPTTLAEAVDIRAREGALPFAGGTDLMVKYHYETGVVPNFGKSVLFLDNIQEIRCVERDGEELWIGGSATLNQVLRHEETPDVLRKAVRSIAAPALRNVGTVAGNLCNGSPAGDSILALYVLGARVELSGAKGKRELPVAEFIQGPGSTALREDELVSAIRVPLPNSTISVFRKVGTRRANALTKVSLAARALIGEGGEPGDRNATVEECAVALGAVAPTVVRRPEIEEEFAGKSIGEIAEKKEELIEKYAEYVRPIDDQRSTAAYRKKVALNMLRSFIDTELLGKEEKKVGER